MDFSFTPEQEAFRDSIREFNKRECTPEIARRLDEDEAYPRQAFQRMAELGWLGLPFPEEYGGLGGTAVDIAILVEELARGMVAAAQAFGAMIYVGGPIYQLGNEEQRQRFLPGTNPQRHDFWLFDINVCFPNFFIDVANGWFFTYHFWPVAVDHTFWQYRFYMFPPADPAEMISREYAKVALRDLLREDLSTVEATQRGLASGAIREVYLSDQEIAVRHQYQVVDQMIRGARVA
jgi:phenylpropionate dioxygenase-like ring-hydroxylating dioxygenase large terminal subunit